MQKYFVKTFGCQMNYNDSERIAGLLECEKFIKAEKSEDADLIIFNTCGIRQAAEDRACTIIHNLKKQAIKNNRQIKIILTGCLANRPDIQKKLKNKIDLFFSINDFEKFKNWIIENCLNPPAGGENSKLEISAQNKTQENIAYLSIAPKYSNKFQASVPIMTGCNNFCAYCVVPYARGREVSRPAKEIISEIKNLVKNGCKEITLLGQNVNSYRDSDKNSSAEVQSTLGTKEDQSITFPKLLKLIEKIPRKFWVRFVSSHPKDFSDELIKTIAKSKKVCEHIHLPIQSGSDKILSAMNRKYTAKHYLDLISKIKTAFKKYKPDVLCSITSDIIVGFPGETKKDFLESARIMEKIKYDLVFFGQFSPRPNTAAWKMKDNILKAEKEKREKYLNEILKKTSFENNKKYENTMQEVLIEEEKDGYYFGKTRTGKNVKFSSSKKNLVGKFVKIKIIKANVWNLEGTLK